MPRTLLPLSALLCSLVLAGCGDANRAPSTPKQTPLGTITGTIHGGQQAVQSAHIYVFQVGTSGYGGQSVSLLNNVPLVTSPDTSTFPGQTIYYVTSGSAASAVRSPSPGTMSAPPALRCTYLLQAAARTPARIRTPGLA